MKNCHCWNFGVSSFGQPSKLQVFGDLGLELMLQNLWKFCEINLTFIWVMCKKKFLQKIKMNKWLMVKVGHSRLFIKKFGFHPSRANKRKKTVSNYLRNKNRSLLFSNRKDHIYYRCFQIKKKIFIIHNSRCHFVRELKARSAISDCYEGFFVFLIFGPSFVGWPWESFELGKGFSLVF
jgi:hypothetical protein